jgi:hypothetical protein
MNADMTSLLLRQFEALFLLAQVVGFLASAIAAIRAGEEDGADAPKLCVTAIIAFAVPASILGDAQFAIPHPRTRAPSSAKNEAAAAENNQKAAAVEIVLKEEGHEQEEQEQEYAAAAAEAESAAANEDAPRPMSPSSRAAPPSPSSRRGRDGGARASTTTTAGASGNANANDAAAVASPRLRGVPLRRVAVMLSGVAMLVVYALALFLDRVKPGQTASQRSVSFPGGYRFDLQDFAAARIITLILFICKNGLYLALHPQRLLLLHAHMHLYKHNHHATANNSAAYEMQPRRRLQKQLPQQQQ